MVFTSEGSKTHQGFTVVELLIVIVVIGILAAISIVSFSGIQQKARDSQRKSDLAQISKGLVMWSIDTGQGLSQMNTGHNGVSATGWFDSNYGGGSVQAILKGADYIGSDFNDPRRDPASNNRWRYIISPCTDSPADNRRVIMMEMEQVPDQTIAQQSAAMGCDAWQIASYASGYKVNFMRLAGAGQ